MCDRKMMKGALTVEFASTREIHYADECINR